MTFILDLLFWICKFLLKAGCFFFILTEQTSHTRKKEVYCCFSDRSFDERKTSPFSEFRYKSWTSFSVLLLGFLRPNLFTLHQKFIKGWTTFWKLACFRIQVLRIFLTSDSHVSVPLMILWWFSHLKDNNFVLAITQ